MKRAYKLQEFVAHSSPVNCLQIGKKTSRVLVTGGEDHKVNVWAIGKPNALLSLSGHSSAVESVTFDSSEVLVAAGASSGTIKLWDLEEAKLVRTLTGHRSNCICVDFHPFGEFFASGSLDTNLKIWDIRRKGCIHTYKGHTRGINAIKFSPDGRWVVSGGEDNIVKLWDLTAGKLMHDFKCHEGQIQCVDFHPQEFLLATGSADRTVRFWDLETFELIGTAGPETTVVRSMVFNPDGRTLLAGLHESLKVYSWEPLRCHDAVEVGWSKLADVNVHEGKLLGCSYNQCCVGIWVVDISRVGPYASAKMARTNGTNEVKMTSGGHQSSHHVDGNLKTSVARLSLSQNPEQSMREPKAMGGTANGIAPGTPQRGAPLPLKNLSSTSAALPYVVTPKRNNASRVQPSTNFSTLGRPAEVMPVIVPRISTTKTETAPHLKRDTSSVGCLGSSTAIVRSADMTKVTSNRGETEKLYHVHQSGTVSHKNSVSNGRNEQNLSGIEQCFPLDIDSAVTNNVTTSIAANKGNQLGISWIGSTKFKRNQPPELSSVISERSSLLWPPSDRNAMCPSDRLAASCDLTKRVLVPGHAKALVESWENREKTTVVSPSLAGSHTEASSGVNMSSFMPRGSHGSFEGDCSTVGKSISLEDFTLQHNTFVSVLQTRLTKLQVIRRFWQRNDLKGAIEAMCKMGDHSVSADVISVLNGRSDIFTLEVFTITLPLLAQMLQSEVERHLSVAMDSLLMLVKTFGDVIRTTMEAAPTIGVDLMAEERIERCKLCHNELEKIKHILVPLTRKAGVVSKVAQELILTLQDV